MITLDMEETAIIAAELTLDAVKAPGPVGFKGPGGIDPWTYYLALVRNEHADRLGFPTYHIMRYFEYYCDARLPWYLRRKQ